MSLRKKIMMVLLSVILCVVVLFIIFRPVIADYIQDLLDEAACICVGPSMPAGNGDPFTIP